MSKKGVAFGPRCDKRELLGGSPPGISPSQVPAPPAEGSFFLRTVSVCFQAARLVSPHAPACAASTAISGDERPRAVPVFLLRHPRINESLSPPPSEWARRDAPCTSPRSAIPCRHVSAVGIASQPGGVSGVCRSSTPWATAGVWGEHRRRPRSVVSPCCLTTSHRTDTIICDPDRCASRGFSGGGL